MLGLQDIGIQMAYLLCIASALACVIYGACNWNRGHEDEDAEINEELQWETVEHEIEESL